MVSREGVGRLVKASVWSIRSRRLNIADDAAESAAANLYSKAPYMTVFSLDDRLAVS